MDTKFLSVVLTFAIALSSLGYVNPAFAGKPDSEGNHDHGGGGGDGDGTIPVMVTFRDVPGDASGDRVRSDGFGAYIDGVDKVSTAVGHEGSFYLKRSRGNQEAKRKLILDFSDCASGCVPPKCYEACTALRGKVGGGGINLSTMGIGSTEKIALFISMYLGAENEGFFFLHFDGLREDCPSLRADVTRFAVGTWEIEGWSACLERLDGNDLRGSYTMPFMMTVQAL